jgi:hypothetical protein
MTVPAYPVWWVVPGGRTKRPSAGTAMQYAGTIYVRLPYVRTPSRVPTMTSLLHMESSSITPPNNLSCFITPCKSAPTAEYLVAYATYTAGD